VPRQLDHQQQQQKDSKAEQQQQQQQAAPALKNGCLMCSSVAACVLLMPCKHMAVCRGCSEQLKQQPCRGCPKCGKSVAKHIVVHLS
jgi:RING finger protein 26